MRMLLCAENFIDYTARELSKLLNSDLLNKKIALIPNAGLGSDKQLMAYEKLEKFTTELDMYFRLIDLEKMDKKRILDALNDADIISISGGLVSVLMRSIEKIDLFEEIKSIIKRKVFIGFSAGAMCLSKTQFVAEKYIGEIDPDVKNINSFGLINFEIYPHFNEVLLEEIKAFLPEKVDVYCLKDDEAIVINGSNLSFIGNPLLLSYK